MTNDSLFQTIDASALPANLLHLLERTAKEKGRIEITNADGAKCVMLSKDELDSLEEALDILSRTHDGLEMQHNIEHFAHIAEQGVLSAQAPLS